MSKFIAVLCTLLIFAGQAFAVDSKLPTGIGSGKGIDFSFSFSTAQLKIDDGLTDKERAIKTSTDSCNDLVKSAEELAAKKADEQIVARAKSSCINKLGSINLDIKIPSLFDMLLAAAKKRIMDEIDKACAKVNNAIGSASSFQIGGNVAGQQFGIGGGVQTGNGSKQQNYTPPTAAPDYNFNSSSSSNINGVNGGSDSGQGDFLPGVKF